MFCQKCGNNLPDGANFCNNCGTQVCVEPKLEKPLNSETTSEHPDSVRSVQSPINQPSGKKDTVSLFTIVATAIMLLSFFGLPLFNEDSDFWNIHVGPVSFAIIITAITSVIFCLRKKYRSFLFSSAATVIGFFGFYVAEKTFMQNFAFSYHQHFNTTIDGNLRIETGYIFCVLAAILIMFLAISKVNIEKKESTISDKPLNSGKKGSMIVGVLLLTLLIINLVIGNMRDEEVIGNVATGIMGVVYLISALTDSNPSKESKV